MNDKIVKKEEHPLESRTIIDDISSEMMKRMFDIKDVISQMQRDTHVEEDVDDNGRIIRSTVVNPLLLPWVRELRMYLKDMWKIAGGEIQQEQEKEKIKVQGKMILEAISDMSPEQLSEKFKEWKKIKDEEK